MLSRQLETLRLAPTTRRNLKTPSRCSPPMKGSSRESSAVRAATREASSPSPQPSSPSPPPSTTSTSSPPFPLPTTYRRLVARVPSPTFRDAARIEELPLSTEALGEGQVLVKVAVAGVNSGCETFRVRAEPGTPFEAPPSSGPASLVPLGAEGAGTVVAVGPGVRPSVLRVGDRVTVGGGSAFAEFVVVGARACFRVQKESSGPRPLRRSLSPAEAVALSLSGLTAAVSLKATAKARRGETVLVTAAAGGTGHLAVQLAALAGCRVVAVAGGRRKASRLREELRRLDPEDEMGHVAIDYKSGRAAEDLSGAISEALSSKRGGRGRGEASDAGVDVFYDGVGGDVRRAVLRNLSRGARVLSVGYMSSYPHTEKYREGAATRRVAAEGGGEDEGGAGERGGGEEEGGAGERGGRVDSVDDDSDVVEVSGPGGAEPRGEASVPREPSLFWQRLVVPLPGDRTIFGDVWSGASGDPRTLSRLRAELFALAETGDLVPWVDDGDGAGRGDVGGEGEGEKEGERAVPPPPSAGPRFVGLESASDAVERLLSGDSMGKVVLRVSGGEGGW